jgi:hypothetical protein
VDGTTQRDEKGDKVFFSSDLDDQWS